MKVSFARQVKEEVVFNDFDICCQKAILSAIIKVNGTLSLSNQGLLLTIRTENAKIASKVHKMLKEVYHPHIEFLVSRKMKLQKNNVYILKVSKAREILDDLGLMKFYFDNPGRINSDVDEYLTITKDEIIGFTEKYIKGNKRLILNYLPKEAD